VLPIWVPVLGASQRDLTPGLHFVASRDSVPAMTVKSSDTTLDLTGFDLLGSHSSQQDHYSGIGLLFDHCKNLVVKFGKVHGYRINVLLRGCKNVRIENLRAGYSHAFPIRTSTGQPIDKFLNLRDLDSWTAYGSGFWFHNCSKCRLVHCSAHHAMNGAVLVTSTGCSIYNCDFSYNSGWGIALWASSNDRLTWNHLDFCNRPWSGGWGGDSAGMALVNDSNENVVVGNSMTHGGDGFFLADKVEGGWNETDKKFHFEGDCSHNVIWKNDGSWASANAFEATFSNDNLLGENQANDSSYGFWLGYSRHSLVASNHADGNDHDGIAIEHGQANRILSNTFEDDHEAAVHLWSAPGPKDLDCPSVDNVVAYNSIEDCGVPLDLAGSSKTTLLSNGGNESPGPNSESVTDLQPTWKIPDSANVALARKPTGWKSYRDSGGPEGQAWIQAGVYAPIPFINYGAAEVNPTTYKLWFSKVPSKLTGPKWVTLTSDQVRNYVTATSTLSQDPGSDRTAAIRFDSGTPTEETAIEDPTDKLSQMDLRFRTGAWSCRWFTWKGIPYDDRKAWLYLFDSVPAAKQILSSLNASFTQKPPLSGSTPQDHYALLATRQFSFTAGIYNFTASYDNAIRVFVDGREIISEWEHRGGAESVQIPLSEGDHDLKVEYCQEVGPGRLKVDWSKVRSTPSLN
jgi:parallel beta-helix repeat protein